MAHTRNFAELGLPDIDSAPQEYQTPDLIDDDGVSPATRSTSASSSYKDLDDDDDHDETSSRIERPSLHPSAARSHFARSKVDARRADFSDRLHSSRHGNKAQPRSYRVSSRRRRRKDGIEEFANGRFSDEDEAPDSDFDEETLEQRIARLKREVEEVQAEASRTNPSGTQETHAKDDNQDAMAGLSSILKALDTNTHRTLTTAAVTSESSVPPPANVPPQHAQPPTTSPHTLQKAAQIESRLATLESALGIPASSPFLQPSSSASSTSQSTKTVLASLSLLETQLSIISATTAPSLDNLSRQISSLTQDAERLAEARSSAATAAAPTSSKPTDRPRSGITSAAPLTTQQRPTQLADTPDETTKKVAALHAALPQIERLAPILPAVLERLRSLRALHAQASVAGEQLAAVEKLQARCADEIARWQEGLERVEKTIAGAQEKSSENKGAVETWVKDLESRMEAL